MKEIRSAEKTKKINDKLAVNTENDSQKKRKKFPKLKKEKQSNHFNQEKLTSNKYECSQCSAIFNLKKDFIAHSKTIGHQIPKKIHCIECGKKFKFEEDLTQHFQDAHPLIQTKEKNQPKSNKIPYEITQIRSIFKIIKDGIKETRNIESLLLFSQENLEKYGISFTDRNRICWKIRRVKDKKVQITLKESRGEIVEILESLQKISEDKH